MGGSDQNHPQLECKKAKWLSGETLQTDEETLYSQQKQDRKLTVAQIMNTLLPDSNLN